MPNSLPCDVVIGKAYELKRGEPKFSVPCGNCKNLVLNYFESTNTADRHSNYKGFTPS